MTRRKTIFRIRRQQDDDVTGGLGAESPGDEIRLCTTVLTKQIAVQGECTSLAGTCRAVQES